jgi:hypothetical protein
VLALPLGLLGATFVLLGGWAGVDSGSFSDVVANFGPENDHLVHDVGAASVAIGLGLLVAVRLRHWRIPVLAVAGVWNGLHLLSHVVDLDDAGSLAVGVVEVVLLVVATALLILFARTSRSTP